METDQLNNLKYRKSKLRKKILNFLQKTHAHPTAETIYNNLRKKSPRLSLGTIYRNLKILKNTKLIKELEFGNSFNRYDGDDIQHYHLICKKCDMIYDIIIPELENLNKRAEKQSGFKIDTHCLNFHGTCPYCLKKTKNTDKKNS